MFTGAPTVLGHRGLGAGVVQGHRENTLSSFLAAAGAGADWVEVDVRRTGDGALVVSHNPAYADGAFLVDLTAEDAAARGTLAVTDLLDALPAGVGVDFDLKSSLEDAEGPTSRTAELLAPLARLEGRRRPVAVTSFDPAAAATVRAVAPEVALGLLTWVRFPVDHAVAATAHLDVDFLALHAGSLRPGVQRAEQPYPLRRVVSVLHAAGRELLVWNPAADELAGLVAAGVDAVCVNDVRGACRELGRAAR